MTSSRENTTLSELLAQRDTLVLSPHMDDAMLSASAVVLDHPSDVWTVFTAAPEPKQTTSWDLSCGFCDSDATITARKAEDAAAFAGTPARTRHLDQLEGAYATREQHRAAIPVVEAEIEAWMNAHPDGVVLTPACAGLRMPPPVWQPLITTARRVRGALGRGSSGVAAHDDADPDDTPSQPAAHAATAADTTASLPKRVIATAATGVKVVVQRALHAEHLWRRRRTMGEDGLAANPDHIALRDLTLRVAERHPGVQVVLYEELPYLWHARADDEVADVERRIGRLGQRVDMAVDIERKHARLAAYTSQLPVLDGRGRLLEASRLPTHEVYWILQAG